MRHLARDGGAAREKAGGRADVLVADMRRMPVLGEFDLITCIDDAINHLLGPDEVADAFAGMRENLAPGGLLVFDVNTLAAYQGVPDVVVEDDERLLRWRGGLAELDGPGRRGRGRHRRLHPRGRRAVAALTEPPAPPSPPDRGLRALAEQAGLEVAAVLGQRPGAVLDEWLDERVHRKAVFVMRRGGRS